MAHPTRNPCGACGGTTDGTLLAGAYTYDRCAACSTAVLSPLPAHDPATYYDAGYFTANRVGGYADYDADGAEHARNARDRLDRIAPHLDTDGVTPFLIDVGCASGYVLDEAVRRSWQATGIDVSAWARERATAKGHHAAATLAEAVAASDRRPDVVAFFQVLEHLHDPYEQMAVAIEALAPRGLLVIETWDAASRVARLLGHRWQQVSPPSVTHLFTLDGLRRHLTARGVEVVSAGPTSKRVTAALVAGVVAQHVPGQAERLRRLGRSRFGRLAVPYRLGDLVTLVARRP